MPNTLLLAALLTTLAGQSSGARADDELKPIEAIQPVAREPRKVGLQPRYGAKFAQSPERTTHTVINPFLDTAGLFFASIDSIQCMGDGGLVVTGLAGMDANFKAIASGAWKVAPDGSIRSLHARTTVPQGGAQRPLCEAPFSKSYVGLTRGGALADGGFLIGAGATVLKLRPDGQLQRLAGPPAVCSGQREAAVTGLVDGPADTARFSNLSTVVPDSQGNIWLVDQDMCSLRRLSPDGVVSTVIPPEKVCRKDLKGEDRLLLNNMTWDPTNNELVSGGWLTVAVPVHNLYNTIWRIKPNGDFRRVHFSTKLGKSPAKIGLDGITTGNIAVDAKGRIHILTMPMIFEQRGFDIMQIYRVDEAKNTVTPLTGHKIRRGSYIRDLNRDGPAELAVFEKARGLCSAPDGSFYILEEHLVRKMDAKGQVSTWLF